jgi:hypothetical protein
METVQKTLEMPSDTLKALEQLAKITSAQAGVPQLIQDALRVYEWVVYQQANGNTVTAVPPNRHENLAAPDAQVLGPLFDDKAAEEAKRFFKAA